MSTENKQNGISRRDFLKIGGLTAASLTAATVVKETVDATYISSPEEYGEFYIKYWNHDNPPYKVAENYSRPESLPVMMPAPEGEEPLDMMAMMAGETGVRLDDQRAGFTRMDYALDYAAAIYFMADYPWHKSGSGSTIGSGKLYEMGRWDFEAAGLTQEDLSRRVKKAAKFFGASLSGIAPVDERWFFKKAMPKMPTGGPPPGMDMPAMELEPAMLPMIIPMLDPEKLPEGITIEMLENPATLPDDFDLSTLKGAIDPSKMPPGKTPPGGENSHASGEMPPMPPMPDIIFSDEYDEPTELEDGTKVVPRSLNRVVVMAFEIDADAYSVDASPISMAGSMNAYSRMWFTATQLAEFIRALGYNAIPMGNDTSLAQPIAIDAGLGEMSRMGLMVTPKYGPRVRLAKILTDMPLTTDRPITFGVDEFCQICGKCAENCPSGSVMHVGEEKSYEAPPSGHSGVLKWSIDGAKCQNYWMKEGAECHICLRVCPFTKPDGWLHDATKILIGAKSGSIDSILLKLDDVSGYGPGVDPDEFWEMDDYIHVKD